MKRIIVDTGVWYACFDKTDENYPYSNRILSVLQFSVIIVPFPTLYETLNTRFVKNTYGQMDSLNSFLSVPERVHLVSDTKYKEKALLSVLSNVEKKKHYSLVDLIIRLMMEDTSLGEKAVMTFNVGDFMGVNNTELINPRCL